MINKTKRKTQGLFILVFLSVLIFVIAVTNNIIKNVKTPSLTATKYDLAVRGDIYSKDHFTIAYSQKIYRASVDTRCIDPNKKDFFIKLFSIYSSIDEEIVRQKIEDSLKNGGGYLELSSNISSRQAPQLKELRLKLLRFKVFKTIIINNRAIKHALDITESGEKRYYKYDDTLTPVIGYLKKGVNKDKKYVLGLSGIEQKYEDYLSDTKKGIVHGQRDVASRVIFNKQSIIKPRVDGINLSLNIPLKLQKNIEIIADKWREKLQAKEVLISIMDSKTGKILAMVSSNRFNPNRIYKEDLPNLSVHAINYQFEPGSVMKPIVIALALDKNKVKQTDFFNAYNGGTVNKKGYYPKGAYKINKRFVIHDDHQFKSRYISLKKIIIHSSNIGTLQIAKRLTAKEFLDGYHKFGFGKKSDIDLKGEKSGKLQTLAKLSIGSKNHIDNVYKATMSYGQGMTATFIQLLKAYGVFNNNGISITPRLLSHYITADNKRYYKKDTKRVQVITKKSANIMKKYLIAVVKEGTGSKTNIEGLEIGGKTGTANIARKGRYQRKYISSFFGFANDSKQRYTIGVTVFEPIATGEHWYYYYASNSAVPIFAKVIKTLVRLDYLKPDILE
jgi:cell division protein FtsI (penicillin-binding protein 3)